MTLTVHRVLQSLATFFPRTQKKKPFETLCYKVDTF